MKTIKYLFVVLFLVMMTSCHKEEKKQIRVKLSEAKEIVMTQIIEQDERTLYSSMNFHLLCQMSELPTSLASARCIYANGSYNDAGIAMSTIEKALEIAIKIDDSELVTALYAILDKLRDVQRNATIAKENYFDYMRYSNPIVSMRGSAKYAYEKMEECEKMLDK